MSFADLKSALQDWRDRFGYYMAKDVDYRKPIEKVARYVSKYACKGVFEIPFVARLNLPKSFRLFSKGLGKSYIHRMAAFHTFSNCSLSQIYLSAKERLQKFHDLIMIHTCIMNPFILLKDVPLFRDTYLDVVLERKFVQVNGYKYHMPRYYVDKIFKKEIPLGIVKGSKKKIMVKTPLSVALANRAWMLRCQRDNESRISNSMDGHSGYEKTALSEAICLLERDSKAKQSLFRFYQFARV